MNKKLFIKYLVPPILLGFIIILAFVFYPSLGLTEPTISWTPSQATETIAQGDKKTTVVSFTSNNNITNVVIWIVPKLQPYMSATPSSFSSITAGDIFTLTLTLSTPLNAPLGTLEGTLHLKDNSGKSQKTYAQPLPITLIIESATANWPVYQSQTYGISFEYPPTWQITESIQGGIEIIGQKPGVPRPIKPGSMEGVCKIGMTTHPNPNFLSLNDWLTKAAEETGAPPPLSLKNIVVDGITGVEEVIEEMGLVNTAYFPIGNNILAMELLCGDDFYSDGYKIFNAILNTIKFNNN